MINYGEQLFFQESNFSGFQGLSREQVSTTMTMMMLLLLTTMTTTAIR